MKEKLKSCPFCGEKTEIYLNRYVSERWTVGCLMCDCRAMLCETKKKAIKAWNRRPK